MLFSKVIAAAVFMGPALVAGFASRHEYLKQEPKELKEIELQAGGKLPHVHVKSELSDKDVAILQLLAFNEFWEVAFFESLMHNVSFAVPEYEIKDDDDRKRLVKVLETIIAQEKLHALSAVNILKEARKFVPSPCKFNFHVFRLDDAVLLATVFTDVVIGALQSASFTFSKSGHHDLVRLLSSIISQEGEQAGYYRDHIGLLPAEKPFLTTVPPAYAWSTLQDFIVPGSCFFNLEKIHLPAFPELDVNGRPFGIIPPKDKYLEFSAQIDSPDLEQRELFITYLSGQQLPISRPINDVKWENGKISFKAPFPYDKEAMGGSSQAALTTQKKFSGFDDLVANTVAGPVAIQVLAKTERE